MSDGGGTGGTTGSGAHRPDRPDRDALRRRLCVALDYPRREEALETARALRGRTGWVKVGLQLFTASGGGIVGELRAGGFDVFLDLKFHDIPNTVAAAVVEAARHGASMMNVHAAGGVRMMRAAAEALAREARGRGAVRPLLLGVTVLTSLDDADLDEVGLLGPPDGAVERLAALARRAGCDGVVCSPREIALVRARCGDAFAIVTPGIRPAGGASHPPAPADAAAPAPAATAAVPPAAAAAAAPDDQRRVASAAGALAAGADLLVVGRPVTGAADPPAAVEALLDEIVAGGAAGP